MSIEEKRGLVYELAKRPNAAFEMLQSWSRQDILQILCLELGKERKYTGLTKLKIIENLLKVVTDKNSSVENNNEAVITHEQNGHVNPKRQKKSSSDYHNAAVLPPLSLVKGECTELTVFCTNSACRAGLSPEDKFCKRCSCCVCRKFDDNKDPSLWLTCGSEAPFDGDLGCNMSCHLECALKDERSRIGKIDDRVGEVDGSFCCVSCGKTNDLLRCWRKQLAIAMETRRVDILCYRVSLCQRLMISGSKKYENLSKIVEEAANKLQAEVGALSGIGAVKMGRGIVNRMSCGQEVQRLCASAVDSLDKILSEMATRHYQPVGQDSKAPEVNSKTIRFEDIGATCATLVLDSPTYNPTGDDMRNVCYAVWHRKAGEEDDYKTSSDPTCTMSPLQTRFFMSGLTPSTEYIIKVVCFDDGSRELSSWETRLITASDESSSSKKDVDHVPGSTIVVERSQSPVTNCSTLSIEDEANNITCTSTRVVEVGHCMINSTEKAVDATSSESEQPGKQQVSADPHGQHTCTNYGQSGALKKHGNNGFPEVLNGEAASKPSDKSTTLMRTGMEIGPSVVQRQQLALPLTPCRLDMLDTRGRGKKVAEKENKSRKEFLHPRRRHGRVENNEKEQDSGGGDNDPSNNVENDLELYVKVMRWLEYKGHIEKSFRQKFLTWYSLRATPQEARVVKAFVNVLMDDPASLAEQLLDAFGDIVASSGGSSNRKKLAGDEVPSGFCMKLWH